MNAPERPRMRGSAAVVLPRGDDARRLVQA